MNFDDWEAFRKLIEAAPQTSIPLKYGFDSLTEVLHEAGITDETNPHPHQEIVEKYLPRLPSDLKARVKTHGPSLSIIVETNEEETAIPVITNITPSPRSIGVKFTPEELIRGQVEFINALTQNPQHTLGKIAKTKPDLIDTNLTLTAQDYYEIVSQQFATHHSDELPSPPESEPTRTFILPDGRAVIKPDKTILDKKRNLHLKNAINANLELQFKVAQDCHEQTERSLDHFPPPTKSLAERIGSIKVRKINPKIPRLNSDNV